MKLEALQKKKKAMKRANPDFDVGNQLQKMNEPF